MDKISACVSRMLANASLKLPVAAKNNGP
jgi:hypothetical protein